MERIVHGNEGGTRLVVTELNHIKDLVRQLETHLDGPYGRCKHLTSQIFSLAERSIGLITAAGLDATRKRSGLASATPSALGGFADVPLKSTKRRETMRKHQVRVKAAEGREAPVDDDGHSWRKYGQKPILGSIHPRSYYRCRHRHSQGCKAKKMAQRADDDPTLFDVIYYGTHTCVDTTAATAGQVTAPAPEHDPNTGTLPRSPCGGLIVKTEGLAAATEQRNGNDNTTTPFCSTLASPVSWCLSPATTSDIADEFFDIDVIANFFA